MGCGVDKNESEVLRAGIDKKNKISKEVSD
jgi:hypothetical protein